MIPFLPERHFHWNTQWFISYKICFVHFFCVLYNLSLLSDHNAARLSLRCVYKSESDCTCVHVRHFTVTSLKQSNFFFSFKTLIWLVAATSPNLWALVYPVTTEETSSILQQRAERVYMHRKVIVREPARLWNLFCSLLFFVCVSDFSWREVPLTEVEQKQAIGWEPVYFQSNKCYINIWRQSLRIVM